MNDNIKQEWRDLRFHSVNPNQCENILSGHRRTALQRLADRYLRFSNMALIFTPIMPFSVYYVLFRDSPASGGIAWVIFAIFYFGLCAAMDRWLYYGIRGIDCTTMTVSGVAHKAMFYRKRHLQFVLVLIPLAILLIGGFLYLTDTDPNVLTGVIVGSIVGLTIGLYNLLQFMTDYRTLNE